MAVALGVFVVPDGESPERTLAQIEAADETGLDLVGVQDHRYQRRFLDLPARHAAIDAAARAAGRDPGEIVRACNLNLDGDASTWADQCLRLVEDFRMQTLILSADDGGDPVGLVRRIGEKLAPEVRRRADELLTPDQLHEGASK